MTEENKGGGQSTNPSAEETPNPSQPEAGTPISKEQGNSADLKDLKAQLNEMNSKLERYKEQVKGSSEEALRYKDENEKLKRQIEEIEKRGNVESNPDFQRIVEEQGLEAAIDHTLTSKIASLQKRLDAYETRESAKVFESFRNSHQGLNDSDVLKKFDREFDRLKGVYDDVNEAMEKAYVLAGGRDAEKPQETVDPQKKAAEEEAVRRNVAGGEDDSRPAPVEGEQATKIQQQINDLQYQALVLQASGRVRKAAELLTKVEELKAQLGKQG